MQEPGTNEEILEFVKGYGVEFVMMDKIHVNGAQTHPLFAFLKARLQGSFGNFIKWNFTKFLINKDGTPFRRYGPKDAPFSFEEDIKSLLD